MGPAGDHWNFTFSGSFFGTPFAQKTLFFAMKNQHFEVHFGVQNGGMGGTLFFKIFVIFGFIFGDPVCSENLVFYDEKSRFVGPFWAPKRGPLETHFFMFFVFFKNALMGTMSMTKTSVLQ